MARAEAAHARGRIRAFWGAFQGRGHTVGGHVRLLSEPAYRRLVAAEPFLKRSIPTLIIGYIVILALARVIALVDAQDSRETIARDELAFVAAAVSARLDGDPAAVAEAARSRTYDQLLHGVLPPRATADGRAVVLTDARGLVLASAPIEAANGRRLADILGSAEPLTTFGARAGVMALQLPSGKEALVAHHLLAAPLGGLTVLHPYEQIQAAWRRDVSTDVTLFVSTTGILIVLTYAFYAQAARARGADAIYADTNARAETAFRRARCGLWDWDLTRGRVYWSASMYELLGLSPQDDLIEVTAIEALLHPSDLDLAALVTATREKRVADADRTFRLRRADGSWMWFRLRAEVIEHAETGREHLIGIATDVTEQRRLDEATAMADLRLRDAIESISEAFVLWDAENRLVLCNSKYQQLHGLGDAAVKPGARYADLLAQSRQPLVRTPIPAEGWPDNGERSYDAQLEDGRWLHINERRTKDGGFVSVGTDISQLKSQAEQLRQKEREHLATIDDLQRSQRALALQAEQLFELNERLAEERTKAQEANQIKSEFLANISHELRTPLNAIIGFSEVMVREMFGSLGSERYQEYCRDIQDSGTFLLNVINDILDMSKLESGSMGLAVEPIDMAAIIAESLRIVASQAEEKRIAVTVQVPDALPLQGDRRALKQVMLNLLSNAMKFTPEAGQIIIRARNAGRMIAIFIADSGIGIPAEHVAKLGQPFVQVENQFTKTHKGSGLGLAISRSLVALHGGSMRIRSAVGVGTVVALRLPHAPPRA